ncbi:hypothetical protein [Paenibacillus sp.]|uniref:hypothetical protein n=1 Tax=Paenibacillus sp. TaxID=58172 RepID=UPI002D35331A|nr:hypothetical protein [Paenibacillus sp.]HZG58483.1 hypothetical protein [Paenibacillus sp.]
MKHSKIGIASFILAIVSVIGLIGSAAVAGSMAARLAEDPALTSAIESGAMPEGVGGILAATGLMFFFIVTALVGAVLGLVGLFQKDRLKLFSILGLVFNAVLVAFVGILLIAGMLLGPALPGTF